MYIQTRLDLVGRSLEAATLDDRAAMASVLVMRLEALAGRAPRRQRSDLLAARTCLEELRAVCTGTAQLRPLLHRGQGAMAAIMRVRKADIDAMVARRAERIAAAAQRAEAQHRAEAHKRRIVRILEAAAVAEQPSRFTPQVRQCAALWREAGPCGPAQRALFEAYRAATKAFWDAVRLEHATARRRAAEQEAAGRQAASPRPRRPLARLLTVFGGER